MHLSTASKVFIAVGVGLIAVGLLLNVINGRTLFGRFGRLPGDVDVARGGTRLYAPIVSMLLVSAFFSLLLQLLRRFF